MPSICIVPDCELPSRGHGYCSKHYTRLRRHGTLNIECEGCSRPKEHNGMFGTHRSSEANPFFGKNHTEESKEKMRQGNLGRKHTNETNEKNRQAHLGRKHSAEWNQRISDRLKGRVLSNEHLRKIMVANHRKPNRAEIKLGQLLGRDWKFVGDGQVIIGGKCPDFININGKKQVLELLGTYWHPIFDGTQRIEHYKQYGFECLIIWEDELVNPKNIIRKVAKWSQHRNS